MLKYLPVAWLKAEISLVLRSAGFGRFVKCLSAATSIDANSGGQSGVWREGLERENWLNKMIVLAVMSNQSSFPVDSPRGFA